MSSTKLVSGLQAVSTDTFIVIKFVDSVPFHDKEEGEERQITELAKLAFDVKVARKLVEGLQSFINDIENKE